MAVTPKASWPWVRALLHSVYDQPDAASVHAQFDRVLDALGDKLPKVAEHPEAARADVLAFTAFSEEVWRRLGATTSANGRASPSLTTRRGRGRSRPRPRVPPRYPDCLGSGSELVENAGGLLAQVCGAAPVVVDASASAVLPADDDNAGAQLALEPGGEPAHEAAVVHAGRKMEREQREALDRVRAGGREPGPGVLIAHRREPLPGEDRRLTDRCLLERPVTVHTDEVGGGHDTPQPLVDLLRCLLADADHNGIFPTISRTRHVVRFQRTVRSGIRADTWSSSRGALRVRASFRRLKRLPGITR